MTKFYINPNHKLGYISPEIQGHFAEHLGRCIYEGIYVGEESEIPNINGMRCDVVEALKELRIPVLRWPGGCFADEYHWMDGIGPKEKRKKMINTHWGGVVEDNRFGTHEYMELCRQLGCKTYINGNVGSGTVQEMSQWVEYMTFDGISEMTELRKANGREEPWTIDYFGVGNENWGCGGFMTPEYYGNLYRHYQTYVRNYREDHKIFKIASGPNRDDYDWMEKLMDTLSYFRHPRSNRLTDGVSLHYYTHLHSSADKGEAVDFDEYQWYKVLKRTLYMDELIEKHSAIMERYERDYPVALMVDEWGTWFNCEPGTNPGFLYQQNTMRDALVAGINLNIFNKHCDRVKMANIAQMANVLQAVVLTEGEQMILTPTYHVFNLYKHHQGAELLESCIEAQEIGIDQEYMVPNLHQSVSLGADGKIHITLNNLSANTAYPIETMLSDCEILRVVGEVLAGNMQDHNTFEEPEKVKVVPFSPDKVAGNQIMFTIPACSVLHLEVTVK